MIKNETPGTSRIKTLKCLVENVRFYGHVEKGDNMQINQNKRLLSYYSFSIILGVIWTLLLSVFSISGIKNIYSNTKELSLIQARSFFQEIVTTRMWNAEHGGVYVPVTKETPPNPYLDVADRSIETIDGKILTKINAAYMTRQIAEIALKKNLFWFQITSNTPIRPANKPDVWESKALKRFTQGVEEINEFTYSDDGESLFRYMAPLWVESECLKCHAEQGFSEGDLRGGISVNIKAGSITKLRDNQIKHLIVTNGVIWIIGLIGLYYASISLVKEEREREKLIGDLKNTLDEVKNLSGLLPICAQCKSIRDDKGYWNQLETYIEQHSAAQFSHGMCENCSDELYGEHEWYKKMKKRKTDSS